MRNLLRLFLFVAASSTALSAFCVTQNYSAVTNIAFPKLKHIPNGFMYRAFGGTYNEYEDLHWFDARIPVRTIDFSHAESVSDRYALAFGICTNLQYVCFDRLKSGKIQLCNFDMNGNNPYQVELVVSAKQISPNAVVDISFCNNVKEVRFDNVESIVQFDYGWVPLNYESVIYYVPSDLYLEWISDEDWSYYSDRISVAP